MATDLSLTRLRELLRLSCGSLEAAYVAVWAIVETLPSDEWIGVWWKENADALGKAIGYSYKAATQMENAATFCDQDFSGDAEQLRKARDELVQQLAEINEFYHPAGDRPATTEWLEAQSGLWFSLYHCISAADTAARSLLKSEAVGVSAVAPPEGRRIIHKEFRSTDGSKSVSIRGLDPNACQDRSVLRDYDWPRIVGALREAVKFVSANRQSLCSLDSAKDDDSNLLASSARHKMGHLWTILFHCLTIDPRRDDGVGVRTEDVGRTLYLCLQERRDLQFAAGNLWRVYRDIAPSLKEPFGDRLDYEKLGELERAVDAVAQLTVDAKTEPEETGAGMADQLPPKVADSPITSSASIAEQPSLEARALALLTDHPEWTDTQIAKAADCSRTSLYRLEKFKAARDLLKRDGIQSQAHGSKTDGHIEAWAAEQ